MKSIADICKEMESQESQASKDPASTWRLLCTLIEPLIRIIITECYELLPDCTHVAMMKKVENDIGKGNLSYHNFGLGLLNRFWKQAKIPELWKTFNGNTPAVLSTFPLNEINELRNPSVHHSKTPASSTVLRLFYTTLDLVNQISSVHQKTDDMPPEDVQAVKSISCNLPRSESIFVGREEEIKKLLTWLSRSNRTVLVSITGIGGVGKSALAVEAARRCWVGENIPDGVAREEVRFDAVIWTSAKEQKLVEDHIVKCLAPRGRLEDIVREIIRCLRPEFIRNLPSTERQMQIVQDALSQNRVLLIIDNMETIEDDSVISFLTELPDPSKAIITDRRSVQFSQAIQLKELSKSESVEMILRICEERSLDLCSEDMEAIVEVTAGVPLAIIWAATQVASYHEHPQDLKRRLQGTQNAVLDYLFDYSFKTISENSRSTIRMLAIPGLPVRADHLAEFLGWDIETLFDSLVELSRFALVKKMERETEKRDNDARLPKREHYYAVHPLTRTYLTTGYDTEILHEKIAATMWHVIRQNESDLDWPAISTIDRIDSQRNLLEWAAHDAFERNDYDTCVNLVAAITQALDVRGRNDLWLSLAQLGYQAALLQKNYHIAARFLLRDIFWVNFIWYQFEQCNEAILEAKKLLPKLSNDDLELRAYINRNEGMVAKEQKRYDVARKKINDAIDGFDAIGDLHMLAITYGTLSSLERDLDDLTSAEQHLLAAIEIGNRVINSDSLLTIWYQKMSRLKMKQDCLDEADAWNRKSMLLLDKLKRQVGVAHAKLNTARIMEKQGNYEDALEYALEAQRLFDVYGSREDICNDIQRIRDLVAKTPDRE